MNSKYRIGFLCVCAAFFLVMTAAYKISYDYSIDEYMKQERERSSETKETNDVKMKESIAAKGEAVKEETKGFYLHELHGFVVVYLEDQKTIYEFTEILVSDLPEEVRQEIMDGKPIATAKELYAFLENYSS